MTIENAKNNLNLLDISSISQLDANHIDYWWEEKYLSIKYDDSIPNNKKNDLLALINKARDELNQIEIKIIKQILNDNQKEYHSPSNEYYPENYSYYPKSYHKDFYSDTFWNRFKKSWLETPWWHYVLGMFLIRLIKYYSSN